ncbi:MAG TPA: type II secretion system secretin GspD [Desulfomonilia bacterium]|nr:type II secretion system secretin GspD [Desulfomonilia bacterium]
MDTHRIISLAVVILLICVSGLWGARLIQDESLQPLQNQTTQNSNTAKSRAPQAVKQQSAQGSQQGKTGNPQETVIPLDQYKQQHPETADRVPGIYLPKSASSASDVPDMNPGNVSSAPAAPPAAQSSRQPTGRGSVDASGQFITMDFDGVDIKVFIKFIADITGKNFIIDDKVTGKVTVISPRKMTMDEAYRVFLSVLEVNGFGTVDMGGVTKVVRAADAITKSLETTMEPPMLRDDTMVTQIIQLKFADANDMKNLLTPLMSKASSQLLSYPQSNVLIVTDTKANIKKIMEILKVVDMAGFAQEVKIFPLTYASATDLSAKLSDILSEGKQDEAQRMRAMRQPEIVGTKTQTKIIPYERTNSLIVMAPPTDLGGIEELIKKLDIPTPTGKEDIHVYYLQYASAEDMAKVLTEIPTPANPEAPQTGQPGAPKTAQPGVTRTTPNPALKEQNIKISPDKETNSLIIYADPYQYKSMIETIKFLDIPRKQVYVQALIMEVNTTHDFNFGVEWTYAKDFKYDNDNKTGAVFGRTGNNFLTSPSDLPTGPLLGVIGQAITIQQGSTTLTFPNMASFINAMANDSDVNVISTPQILTMDNKEAEIKVGSNVPYVTNVTTDQTNINNSVRTFDYRDVGVSLKLTPQINQQGDIRMKLFAETSSLVAGTGDTQLAPTTLKRSTSTTVNLHDGATMVIGGLIGDTLSLGNNRVPLFGDIPILGYLFKTITRSRQKTNLYIFLTPYIIDTNDKAQTLYNEKSKESEQIEKNLDTSVKRNNNEKNKP